MRTNKEEFEQLVSKCYAELTSAYKEKYDAEKAEGTAAMFLAALMQLAYFVEDIEAKARHSKTDIERIEAEKYFEYKNAGGKLTEAALSQMIAKDKEVQEAKTANNLAEAELKKYSYLMASLKEAQILFRNIRKDKDAQW
jgi:hypothetical protein